MGRAGLHVLVMLALAGCGSERSASRGAAVPSSGVEAGPDPAPPALRLPADPRPIRYNARLTVVPARTELRGTIVIELLFRERSSFFWLNATELAIESVELTQDDRTMRPRVVPGGGDFVGFAFHKPIESGPAYMRIVYRGGVHTADDRGLFTERAGDQLYAFTQLENIEARSVFPCFDEPSFKVPWRIALDVRESDVAVSNTPILSSAPIGNGMKRVQFAETKPLPSYLVAFAVGPFDVVDGGRAGVNATPINIFVPRGAGEGARYAAASTKEMFDRLETLIGRPYPYEKLDIVAVPHLVSFAAMENAGLVTMYRDGVVAGAGEETPAFRRNYSEIMAHELAHQWFGNLVTLSWWDDVWLNESFASWIEAKMIARWKPEWAWDAVIQRRAAEAMDADGLASARRIRQAIASKDDIQNAFDGITYSKGNAVLVMFEAWVGEERFKTGIQRYLDRHAHGNATSADFLGAIGDGVEAPVAAAFSTFLDRPGVPVVRAELACEKKKPAKLTITQSRYAPAGGAGAAATSSTAGALWQIPVCVRWADGRVCTLLRGESEELVLGATKKCPKWIFANEGGRGYYHMDVDAKAFATLLALPANTLSLAERLALIRDAAAMAGSGALPVEELLARLPALAADKDLHVQRAAAEVMASFRDELVREDLRPKLSRFVAKTFGPRARAIGLRAKEGEADEVRLLRPLLVPAAASRGGDAELIAEAKKLADVWLRDPAALEEDSVASVLELAAQSGDRTFFERLRVTLKSSSEPRRRDHLIDALASFRDPALVRESLQLFLAPDLDPREAVPLMFQDARMQDVVWSFVKENYEAFVARLPNELRASVPRIGEPFCDAERRADVETFFRDRIKDLVGGPRNLQQTLESITRCAALREAQAPSFERFLSKY